MHKKGSEARGSKNWWPVRPFRYFKFTLFVSKLATLTLFRRCTITNDVAKSSTFRDITARLAMTRSIYVAQLSTLLLLLCCSSRTASAAAVRVWNSRSAVHRADCLSCERSDLALPPHLRLTPPLWTEKKLFKTTEVQLLYNTFKHICIYKRSVWMVDMYTDLLYSTGK